MWYTEFLTLYTSIITVIFEVIFGIIKLDKILFTERKPILILSYSENKEIAIEGYQGSGRKIS